MPTDNTGVPLTCHHINFVISFLESINESADHIIELMEDIRKYNKELREYCCEADKIIAEYEGNIDELSRALSERDRTLSLLEGYTKFLEKNGYIDSDWRDEPPSPIDEFMNNR